MGLLKKPGVNRKVHLFAAPFLWTTIGCLLMFRGYGWLGGEYHLVFLVLALLLGTAKSLLVLDKTVKRSVKRLVDFENGRCLGAVYSWQTWLLVVLMMICGILLRTIFTPGLLIGTLYCAIGWALCLSSRHGWLAWFKVANS